MYAEITQILRNNIHIFYILCFVSDEYHHNLSQCTFQCMWYDGLWFKILIYLWNKIFSWKTTREVSISMLQKLGPSLKFLFLSRLQRKSLKARHRYCSSVGNDGINKVKILWLGQFLQYHTWYFVHALIMVHMSVRHLSNSTFPQCTRCVKFTESFGD